MLVHCNKCTPLVWDFANRRSYACVCFLPRTSLSYKYVYIHSELLLTSTYNIFLFFIDFIHVDKCKNQTFVLSLQESKLTSCSVWWVLYSSSLWRRCWNFSLCFAIQISYKYIKYVLIYVKSKRAKTPYTRVYLINFNLNIAKYQANGLWFLIRSMKQHKPNNQDLKKTLLSNY